MPQVPSRSFSFLACALALSLAASADEPRVSARPLALHGLPGPLALAATWDPALVNDVYALAAREEHAAGSRMVLGPSLAVCHDPRLGRVEETFGEDPFLVAEMGVAAIDGLQGNGVLAAATGFAGPGVPRGGSAAAPISERELREVYLAPFAVAIERAHPAAIVPSRNAIDGIPSHANARLLRGVLRGDLHFTGQVLADPHGLQDLVRVYHVAADARSARTAAAEAGIDVFPAESDALRTSVPRAAAARSLVLRAATQAIVLLKNEGALPLASNGTPLKLSLVETPPTPAFANALLARRDEAVQWVSPRDADAIFLVMGAPDARSQRAAYDAAAHGHTPVIVVLTGEPSELDPMVMDRASAILAAWNLGPMGGEALAAIAFGDASPSGKLPVTLARSAGELPLFHDAKPSSGRAYLFDDGEPAFPFGWGLSYTTFETSAPRPARGSVRADEPIEVAVDVRNTGRREGEETLQVYVRDKVSTVTTPLLRLAAFRKVRVAPGDTKTVLLTLASWRLALHDASMRAIIEPGDFEILAGPDAAHLRAATVTVQPGAAR